MSGTRGFFPLLAMVAAGLALAWAVVGNPYYLNVMNVVGLNALVAVGLGMVVGLGRNISLGHGGFFGMGAYISGVLTACYGFSPWPTVLLAAAVVGIVALGVGLPALRLKGNYLVMATLGFNIIVTVAILQLDELTGGPSGLSGIPPLMLGPWSLADDACAFVVVWVAVLGGLVMARNVACSRVGRALVAAGESEVAAASCGIAVHRYKVGVFVLSALYASVAGSLYAHYYGIITPRSFDIFKSVELVTMCIVGGMGSVWGALVGAGLLAPLPMVLEVFQDYQEIFYGLSVLVVLVFAPEGVVGWIQTLARVCSRPRGLGCASGA